MRVFNGIDELTAAVGEELGTSDWLTVDQERINTFADATGDHQWIHVDAEQAAAGPFGAPIAHGFLTLSLLSAFQPQIFRVDGVAMVINYGLNKVRFPAPVRVGSRIRARTRLAAVKPLDGGAQAELTTTIEIENADKPACVAESVTRYVA